MSLNRSKCSMVSRAPRLKTSLPRAFASVATRAVGGKVTWPRIAGLALIFCSVAWAGFATTAWAYLHFGRNILTVGYLDTLSPHRWSQIRLKIGENYLEEAKLAVQNRDLPRALHLYRAGLARSPANTEARLALAQIYVASRHPELAKSLLIDRLANFSSHRAYLDAALRFLLDFQYDQDLAATCDLLLAQPLDRPTQALAALYASTVAHLRGSYDLAESILHTHGIDRTPEGTLLLARIDWERGYPDLALLRLSDLVRTGSATDHAYVLIGQIHRTRGQTREFELNATLRLAHSPLSFQPRLDFLRIHHDRGHPDDLAREIDSYLFHFAGDQAALLSLADFAANTGRPDLAKRVEQHFAARGWPADAPKLLTAEAHLIAGDYPRSLELLAGAAREAGANQRFGPILDSLQAVALFGLNRVDEARLHLGHLLTRPTLRAENLQAVATRLLALDQAPHARHLLTRAVELDPLNQSALTELVRLEAGNRTFDTLPTHVRRLMQMRRPSREALALAARAWGSDLNLFHPEQAALLAELHQALDRGPSDRL